MSDILEATPQAVDAPVADTSASDLMAAFSAATPYNPNAEPAPVAPQPEAITPTEATNPVPTPGVAVAPESVAPAVVAPDYAAYLKETFGTDTADALKAKLTLAEQAATFQANQRTAQDVAFEKLLADPAAAAAYVKLQTTDFAALSPRERLAAAFIHAHPELPAELAALEADEEFNAKYSAAEFDDPDDAAVKTAKLRLSYADKVATQTLETAKAAAREAILTKSTSAADGPTPEQVQAEESRAANWVTGVDGIVNAPSLELEYQVDGQTLKLAFDHQSPAFKEAMLDPNKWFFEQICPGGDVSKPNLDRLAEIVALTMQPDVLLKNAIATGKASLGAVISLDKTVNPAPSAPQGPPAEMSIADAFRQSVSASQNRGSQY